MRGLGPGLLPNPSLSISQISPGFHLFPQLKKAVFSSFNDLHTLWRSWRDGAKAFDRPGFISGFRFLSGWITLQPNEETMTRIIDQASLTLVGLLAAATLPAAPEKPRVAVLVFEYEGGTTRVEASGIAEEIRGVFVGSNQYTVVDRTLTDQIMRAWRIRQSGLTARQKALKAGRLYNVQMVITGKLLKFPEGGWQVSSVMLDAQTGIAKRAETIHFMGGFFRMLARNVPSMAFDLAGIPAVPAVTRIILPRTITTWGSGSS